MQARGQQRFGSELHQQQLQASVGQQPLFGRLAQAFAFASVQRCELFQQDRLGRDELKLRQLQNALSSKAPGVVAQSDGTPCPQLLLRAWSGLCCSQAPAVTGETRKFSPCLEHASAMLLL